MKLRELIAWSLCALLLFVCRCNPETVTIPEVKGSFNVSKPQPIDIPNVPQVRFVFLTDTVTVTAFIEPSLKDSINNSQTLVQALEHCLDAVKMRHYRDAFEDEHIRIDYFAQTYGKLDSLHLDYLIKERKIKRKPLSIYAGFEYSDRLQPKVNAVINERFNLSVSYGRELNFGATYRIF